MEPVEKFDLKGSSVGRFVSVKKRKSGAILKDLDIKEQGRKLYLPEDKRQAFIDQIAKDTEFLMTYRVMDYSLLLGIYYPTEKNKSKVDTNLKKRKEGGSYISTLKQNLFQEHYNGIKGVRDDGVEEIYYVGIIDILIEYATKKKMEHLFKSLAFSPEEVSVVEPEFYQQRFVNFIKGLVNEPPQHEGKQKKDSSDSDDSSFETETEKPNQGPNSSSTSSITTVSAPTISTVNGPSPGLVVGTPPTVPLTVSGTHSNNSAPPALPANPPKGSVIVEEPKTARDSKNARKSTSTKESLIVHVNKKK